MNIIYPFYQFLSYRYIFLSTFITINQKKKNQVNPKFQYQSIPSFFQEEIFRLGHCSQNFQINFRILHFQEYKYLYLKGKLFSFILPLNESFRQKLSTITLKIGFALLNLNII